jgi:hypothetical protein
MVRVYSGFDGTVLYRFDGDSNLDLFGASVNGAGDVNSDGFDDLIVGALFDDNNGTNSGSARVFSGATGRILYTFDGDSPHDLFGGSVSGVGDVNGDGFDDLVVGADNDDNNGQESGSARVFSGADGTTLYTFYGDSPGDLFGRSVSGAGDVNGDGYPDVMVGALNDANNGKESGSARLFSGLDGSILHTFDGDSSLDHFGRSVGNAGDVNGDGFGDLIVGASGDDNNGNLSGSARVFSGCDDLGTSYCTPAVPNSTGQSAVISACGSDLADGVYFMLHATKLPRSQFGYFLASETQGFIANPGGSQGTLCLGGQIARFKKQVQSSGPSGKLAIRVDLTSIPTTPPHTVLAGETWNFQAWFRDKNPGNTSNFTDGVAVTFL